MSGHSVDQVQEAVYTALSTDTELLSLINGVFDRTSACGQYPYLTISDIDALDWGTHTHQGMEMRVMVHTWNQGSGKRPTRKIMKMIYDLLHEKRLTITDGLIVLMRFDFEELMIENDGITYHGVQRFRVLTREETNI